MPLVYALIREESGLYGATFPDFPGVAVSARSPEDALRKAGEALRFDVAGRLERGDPLPVPRTLADLRADSAFREEAGGAALALVPFDPPTRTVRINISLDEGLLDAVDRAAEAAGQSRSAFLADAARRRILAA